MRQRRTSSQDKRVEMRRGDASRGGRMKSSLPASPSISREHLYQTVSSWQSIKGRSTAMYCCCAGCVFEQQVPAPFHFGGKILNRVGLHFRIRSCRFLGNDLCLIWRMSIRRIWRGKCLGSTCLFFTFVFWHQTVWSAAIEAVTDWNMKVIGDFGLDPGFKHVR